MNKERIKELAKEAGIQEDLVDHLKDEVEVLTYIARPQDIQKFAELIVAECALLCSDPVVILQHWGLDSDAK